MHTAVQAKYTFDAKSIVVLILNIMMDFSSVSYISSDKFVANIYGIVST